MRELNKNEKFILIIGAILLFSGKIFNCIGSFTLNKILTVIAIILKGLFYVIWISIIVKESKTGAVLLFICAFIELLVAIVLF